MIGIFWLLLWVLVLLIVLFSAILFFILRECFWTPAFDIWTNFAFNLDIWLIAGNEYRMEVLCDFLSLVLAGMLCCVNPTFSRSWHHALCSWAPDQCFIKLLQLGYFFTKFLDLFYEDLEIIVSRFFLRYFFYYFSLINNCWFI